MKLTLVPKRDQPYEGNELTGDLQCLRKFVKDIEVNRNWVTGRVIGADDATAHLQVFAESSVHGVAAGRISRLSVFEESPSRSILDRKTVVNYDRGWDVKPTKNFYKMWVKLLVESVS